MEIFIPINTTSVSKKINDYSNFHNNDLVESVIPKGITEIGERVFSQCKNLKKIILPETLVSIGRGAFSECEALETIVLPKSIKKIEYRAFADCKSLKKIVIPEGVEEIGWAAFSSCENLEEIVLPKSIKKIDKQLFLNCKKLKRVVLPPDIDSIPDECFKGCTNLNLTLHPNITQLGNSAFDDCSRLITFPENVTDFGNNCFRNCRSLKNITLSNDTKELPDSMFENCKNLTNIDYKGNKLLKIGKNCFRNCQGLKDFPDFIANFNEKAFENCISLKSINIIDSEIPSACFRGCESINEILNEERISKIHKYAFSGCTNLEEIDIVKTDTIPAEAFSNCKKLRKVRLNCMVRKIGARAFYNCQNLVDINLPDSVEKIAKEAFRACNSIKSITIPANLKSIADAAFSYMDSLECINVSPYNKVFLTPDHKILIHELQEKLVLYASGLKNKSYSLEEYNVSYDSSGSEIVSPINSIGEFAFAGAKNLEELTICGCTGNIETTAFYGCNNLKKLNIKAIPFFSELGIQIKDHTMFYDENAKHKAFLPFEEITFLGELTRINNCALKDFKKVKMLNLLSDKNCDIDENAFSDCSLLEEVEIPKGVTNISTGAFAPTTKLKFINGLEIKGLTKLVQNNQYVGEYKLYSLDDGTYYIEQGDKITKITKHQIDEICSKSEYIRDNPILFLDFMNDLINHDLAIKQLFNGILMSTMSLENRTILFNNLSKDDKFFLDVLKNSQILDKKDQNTESLLQGTQFSVVIEYIELLRKYHIDTPELHNKFFMANLDIKDFEQLINFDLELFKKIVIDGRLLENDTITLLYDNEKDEHSSYYLTYQILQKNTLQDFIRLAKKYDIKDKYLFSKPFVAISKNSLMEDMIRVYDANIKRLLKASQATQTNISAIQNLSDLLILMKITGALEEDPKVRQRASTFISEKIFEEKLPNGEANKNRIIGDDIHRIFNFSHIREDFEEEFANFFLENYSELIKEEKEHSGFIQRVYTNFEEISRTCTSNKGIQRKLKVTINKCKNYLSKVKFDNVTEEEQPLAELMGKWYDSNLNWLNAKKIYYESLKAPRNIFTKIEVDPESGAEIYDYNPANDLKEEINPNYSFEWLPKQNYENLIEGKECNCCAHVAGVGSGIMRASMIHKSCQNLIIRDAEGKTISKSTVYVNREEGYGVFNNVETSLNYRNEEDLEKIYMAFLRGAAAFFDTFNKNNKDNPIYILTIGINRNTILDYLTDDKHPLVEVKPALEYGKYSLSGSGYNGDWKNQQRLVLKG